MPAINYFVAIFAAYLQNIVCKGTKSLTEQNW